MDDEYLEHLIEEHEKDEKEYLERIIDDILESDELDRLIADRLEYIDITDKPKEDIEDRIRIIREEDNLDTKEELFIELIKELDV